jgi:3'(2'), 5'-bisphosphate nucleotidase
LVNCGSKDNPKYWRISAKQRNVDPLARHAGDAIMTFYHQETVEVCHNQEGSRLTQADLASHNIILHGLACPSPEWPILSEESAEIPF